MGTYSETIPTAKDVGSYSVYYKVVGTNANYDYSNAKGSVDVFIHKTYEVTVIDGTGGGKYAEGETVSIKANDNLQPYYNLRQQCAITARQFSNHPGRLRTMIHS